MEESLGTVKKLLVEDVTTDESSSDISTDSPVTRKRDTNMDKHILQTEVSAYKSPKSGQSKERPEYVGTRKFDKVQTNSRQVKPQLQDVCPDDSGSGTVKLTGNPNYLATGKTNMKKSKATLKSEGLNGHGTSKEGCVDKRRDLDADAVSHVVRRNGDNISLEFHDEKGDTVVVDLRRSESPSVLEKQAGETVDGSTVPGKKGNRLTPVSAGADRRGVVIQDSAIDNHSEDNGTMEPSLLESNIQKTKAVFVETENYARVDKILTTTGHVTISGDSGEGKTSLALMLGVKYQQHGYVMVFVNDVDKFKLENHFNLGWKLFVIFDDIFGTVGLSTAVPKLRNILRDLHYCLGNRVSKQGQTTMSTLLVIFTTNTCNLKTGTSNLGWENMFFFQPSTVINLNDQKTSPYSFDERKTMFQKHKLLYNCAEVEFEKIADCEQMGIGFPLSCQLFFQYKRFQNNPKDFFEKPLFHLTKVFENFLEQRNGNAAALILMLLCDGKMDLMQVENGFKNTPFYILLRSVQSLMPRITAIDTASAVRNLQGTFLTDDDIIRFSHHIICDEFACALHKIDPKFVLENCSLKFLYERLRHGSAESVSGCDQHHFIYISDVHHDIIVKRLAQAVKEGIYSTAITHPVLENEQIVDKLFDLLDIQKTNIFSKENVKHLLYWVMHSHNLYLAQKTFAVGFNFSDTEIIDAFGECASSGNLAVMEFLNAKYKAIKQYSIRQALTTATKNNYSDMVQFLLRYCQDVIALQNECNVLVIARENGNFSMEKDIISAICRQRRISLSCSETIHLLHAACVTGDVTLANFVIPGSDINKPFDGFTPVMTAAVLGQRDIFDLLVSKGADLRLTDKHSDTMIHLASVGGSTDIVKHLLPLFDINVRGRGGLTAVMKASVSGQIDVYDLLVSKGADLKLTDNYGNNVLHSASCGNSVYIVSNILPLFDINVKGHFGWTAVMRAAYCGQEDVFDLLMSKGADLTLTDNLGANVLHWACCSHSVCIVKKLLPMFDINIRGYRGFTPVMHSASQGQTGVFKFLVLKGADLKIKDNHDNNVLHWACCSNSTDLVKQLLPMFDINVRGQNGSTPVMNAASHGQRDVFDLLVAEGADLRLLNDYGSNLLYCSSLGGNIHIVEHLLSLLDINSRGRNSMTSVMVAAREGHEEVFALLVKKGADLTLTDAEDNNLLHLAHQGGCESIIGFLSTSHL